MFLEHLMSLLPPSADTIEIVLPMESLTSAVRFPWHAVAAELYEADTNVTDYVVWLPDNGEAVSVRIAVEKLIEDEFASAAALARHVRAQGLRSDLRVIVGK